MDGHALRKNCLLKPVIERRIVTGRRGRRRKKLLDDLKATRGYCNHFFYSALLAAVLLRHRILSI